MIAAIAVGGAGTPGTALAAGLRPLDRIRYPLAASALMYWATTRPIWNHREDRRWTDADEGDAWIAVDCEDEARSAPVEDGGAGMPPAFDGAGLDRRGGRP